MDFKTVNSKDLMNKELNPNLELTAEKGIEIANHVDDNDPEFLKLVEIIGNLSPEQKERAFDRMRKDLKDAGRL